MVRVFRSPQFILEAQVLHACIHVLYLHVLVCPSVVVVVVVVLPHLPVIIVYVTPNLEFGVLSGLVILAFYFMLSLNHQFIRVALP